MAIQSVVKSLLVAILRCYRYMIHSLKGPCCRFYPTCSVYASEAIERHGCIKGIFLTTKRLLSCHPWHAGGYDPVP